MKRRIMATAAIVCVLFLAGCSSVGMSPVGNGWAFTKVQGPIGATDSDAGGKMGTSSCMSILGTVAIGDASIQSAMKDGKITRVHHVDFETFGVLGVYVRFRTIVYGD